MILEDSLDFAKLSNDLDMGSVIPSAPNDTLDLTILTADITKATWARKMQLSSGSENTDPAASSVTSSPATVKPLLDVLLEFEGRDKGWMAQVCAGDLRRCVSFFPCVEESWN